MLFWGFFIIISYACSFSSQLQALTDLSAMIFKSHISNLFLGGLGGTVLKRQAHARGRSASELPNTVKM